MTTAAMASTSAVHHLGEDKLSYTDIHVGNDLLLKSAIESASQCLYGLTVLFLTTTRSLNELNLCGVPQ